MQFSSIKKSIVGKKVLIDEAAIVFLYPSIYEKIWKSVYSTGILLNNGRGIVVPNRNILFNKKLFYGKIHFLDMKKQMILVKHVSKKIPVLSTIRADKNVDLTKTNKITKEKNFYFYDLTTLRDGIEYFREKFPEKRVLTLLLEQLSETYKKFKEEYPLRKIIFIIQVRSIDDFLFHFIKDIRRFQALLKEELSANKFFDGFLFGNINEKLYPVAEYNKDGIFEANIPMITRFVKAVESNEAASAINDSPAISKKENTEIDDQMLAYSTATAGTSIDDLGLSAVGATSLATKIVDVLKDPFSFSPMHGLTGKNAKIEVAPPSKKSLTIKAKPDENDDLHIELDNKTLTKVMRYYKVSNPDIIANTKAAIDRYIEDTGEIPTKENAEKLVLRAVNKSIHGTDKIEDKYLNNPTLLFNQLQNVDVYSVPLNYPKNIDTPFEVTDVVTLPATTGQTRQAYEFGDVLDENVEKVFKTLENQNNHPIKVLGIKYNYEDTDRDRIKSYTVSLQNMDGNKKKYDITVNIPCVVSDKYFKIAGKRYIFVNQQHMKPLTKTNKNDCRILTNYAICRLSIENLKFNVSDVNDILNYINTRYPGLLTEVDSKHATFKDGDNIYFSGDTILESIDSNVVYEDGKIVDKKNKYTIKNDNRNEFLYDRILEKIQTVNPDDELRKSKLSIPYISLYASGIKMPFIIFMWHEKGLLSSLNEFGIDYKIVENTEEMRGSIVVPLEGDKQLVVQPSSVRERLIANGLLVNKIHNPINNVDNPHSIDDHITDVYGARTLFLIDNIVTNMIDPITKELLTFESYPTNLPGLLAGPTLDKLLNDKPDSVADLKIYRSRMSEVVLRILYRQLTRAANSYAHKVDFGDPDAKLMFVPDYVINEFLNKNPPDQSVEKNANSLINLTESVNPIEEIMLASKVVKTGPGGLRTRDEFTPAHRNIHQSQIGNISAVATPESADVGIVCHNTLSPLILNKYGSYGIKDSKNMNRWSAVGMTEALIPLVQEIYSDRAMLATTHSRQVTPVNNSEPPLVITGGEYIVPQIASTRFCHTAKFDGEIIDIVPNETMTVKYNNGKTESFDILPRKSRTKRGAYISLEMDPLPVGTKFKAHDLIASTKNFNNKENMYVSGRNVTVAVVNYWGFSYEDAYVLSDKIASTTTTDTLKEISVIIPPETKVYQLEKEIGKDTKPGEDLVEFAYDMDVSSYMTANDFDLDSDEVETILGSSNNSIYLKSPGGKIVDIKIFINDKLKSDPQIIKFHKELVNKTKAIEEKLAQGKSSLEDQLSASDNLEKDFFKIGEHKQKGIEFRGARIVYSILQPKPVRVGDKIAPRYGAKGLVGKIYHDGTAVASKSGNIDLFISPTSVLGRKNVSRILTNDILN